MKLVYAGTPEFAVPPLRALHAAGYRIAAVLTQPDRPQGRKGILTPSPVKRAATELGIPVLQPEKLKEELDALAAVHADLMVTCAYGQILTQRALDLFLMGVWNVHASLLPAYRGAAPIPRVIMDGERETGVTIMKTDVGLDTGDIFLQGSVPVTREDTCGTLSEKLSALGANLIVKAMARIECGAVELTEQGEGTVCRKVARTQVDFSRPAEEVSALIRALSPAPLAYGVVNGLTVNFLFAEAISDWEEAECGTVVSDSLKRGFIVKCGKGAVRLSRVQPAGGKPMADRDFLNGKKVTEGARFDQPVL